jgi:hypothetical protein
MSNKRLLQYDPLEGSSIHWEGDGKGGSILTYSSCDLADTVDACAEARNGGDFWNKGKNKQDGDLIHYAHIDNFLLLQWMMEGVNVNDPKEIFKKVNSREYCLLKTVDKTHAPRV